MGCFSTLLYYLFIKIFVYCIIIVQIANKVGCIQKKKSLWLDVLENGFEYFSVCFRTMY
jgi:hypothetical protein